VSAGHDLKDYEKLAQARGERRLGMSDQASEFVIEAGKSVFEAADGLGDAATDRWAFVARLAVHVLGRWQFRIHRKSDAISNMNSEH